MLGASLDRLRSRILAGLGVSLSACGLPVVPADDEAGVTTDPSDDGGSSDDEPAGSGTGTSTGTSTSTSTETTDDGDPSTSESGTDEGDSLDEGMPLDLPPPVEPDLPPLDDCTVMMSDASVFTDHPDCPALPEEGWCGVYIYMGCVEPEPGQTCERLCPDGDCVADWSNCQGDPIYDEWSSICGPYEIDGKCCSIAQYGGICSDGRPFVVDDRSRRAALVSIEHRPLGHDRFAALPVELRHRLARRWAEIAAAEHASIASFARFTTQLLAIGAPPELVRDALAAASDEVRHAEVALALASAFEGRPLGLGELDVRGASEAPMDLESLVLACVHEGCIGETMAALELVVAAEACDDPELAASLAAIAEDETRHAELAWRFVKWALDRRPDLRAKIAEPFAALALGEDERESIGNDERELLRSLGCLPADERRRVHQDGIAELLRPCAAALLAA
jgi:hypothetical protein